jgi:SAM-dependent methyltransferase
MGWIDDTRASYDEVAEDYQPMVWAMFDEIVVERSMLTAFASLVTQPGVVADIGCGPGDITAHLAGQGLDMIGIDLSPGMVAVARRNHPTIDFREGDMTALDLADGELAGAVSWWSTVHVPNSTVPLVMSELHRVTVAGGHVLVGFHAGDECRHKTEGYGGHPIVLDVYLRPPDDIIAAAAAAGLDLCAQLTVKRSVGSDQCCLIFRKPIGRREA